MTIPDSPSLRPSSGLTIALWVKAGTIQGRSIISKQYGSYNDDSFVLWYEGAGFLTFYLGDGPRISIDNAPVNEWHHVVATYDGSFMRLYLDGVERVNTTFAGPILYDDNPVLIGADSNNGNHIPDEGWNGAIDEVLIYNRALSQAEITQIIPEFPSVLTLSLFMSATIIGVIVYTRRHRKQANLSFS